MYYGRSVNFKLSSWRARALQSLDQWFSNFLHQVPPQKIFGFPGTTIMTNIKIQYSTMHKKNKQKKRVSFIPNKNIYYCQPIKTL